MVTSVPEFTITSSTSIVPATTESSLTDTVYSVKSLPCAKIAVSPAEMYDSDEGAAEFHVSVVQLVRAPLLALFQIRAPSETLTPPFVRF